MRAVMLAIGAALLLGACNVPCSTSRDCDRGWRCDFVEHICVQGCTEESTCTNGCNLETGQCKPSNRVLFPAVDSGTTTSSTSDASVADAAAVDAG